ncbi:MAG: hypothetical protein IPH07_38545 [Deltaproteobacteria bacterium]|nr:hypothetical protein [Deltaproteobacteria bacterium]MBK8236108.1 hypothetical protein [Deltaproteobacteria bacterium]MBK8713730.1 hypothetical protein [Deltaproteobacteria bacterium]
MKDVVSAIGYRRLPTRARRWAPWPIARTALALALRKRASKFALMACAFVVFLHGTTIIGQVFVGRMLEQERSGDLTGAIVASTISQAIGQVHATLSTFLGVQLHATAVLLGVVAAGLIAEDRRTRAFELYFSRPLRPLDYVIGKGLVALLVPTVTIVVPFVLLLLFAIGIAPDSLAGELWPLLLPGLLGACACALLLATTILGASAVGERGRTVGVAYVLGLATIGAFADGMADNGSPWAGYFGPLRDVQTVVDALLQAGSPGLFSMLDVRASTNDSAWLSALALLLMMALGAGAVWYRMRKELRG